MLRSEDYSEPSGRQMLQVQILVTAMIVLRRRIGEAETLKFRSHVTVVAIQNGGFAKRLHSDYRKVCELMRWGENSDIAFFEQRPIVDTFWRISQIANQGRIYLALQEQFDKAVWRLFSKLDLEAGDKFPNFSDWLKDKRGGNRWGEADSQWSDFLPLKLTRLASDSFRRSKCPLKHRQHRLAQVREVGELTLSENERAPELQLQLLYALGQCGLCDVTHLRCSGEVQRACDC